MLSFVVEAFTVLIKSFVYNIQALKLSFVGLLTQLWICVYVHVRQSRR
jgi:hypothetical protein